MAKCDLLTELPFYRLSNIELINFLNSQSVSGKKHRFENTDLYNKLTALNKSELLQDIKFSYCNTDDFNGRNRELVDNIEISLILLCYLRYGLIILIIIIICLLTILFIITCLRPVMWEVSVSMSKTH